VLPELIEAEATDVIGAAATNAPTRTNERSGTRPRTSLPLTAAISERGGAGVLLVR
jgi:hypothetical protein